MGKRDRTNDATNGNSSPKKAKKASKFWKKQITISETHIRGRIPGHAKRRPQMGINPTKASMLLRSLKFAT